MAEPTSLPELLRPGELQRRLEKIYGRSPNAAITICLLHAGQSQCAIVGPPRPLPIGCLTKLFTATLAGMAIAARHFTLQTPVAELLQDTPELANQLAGISVKQLLEHTHGLDYSRLNVAPLLADGRIDTQALYDALGERRLFDPGTHYSYGSGGTWLLCAALERTFALPYAQLLRQQLCEPLGIQLGTRSAQASARICPALGEDLAVSPEDLVRFLQFHLTGREPWCVGAIDPVKMNDELITLPGWSPLECGVRLSWKHFGAGWFGHNSVLPGAPALIRLHPRHGIGLAIACTQHAPMSVANAVLAGALPDYASIHMPKLLSADETLTLDGARFIGVFANASAALAVSGTKAAALELKAYRKRDGILDSEPFFSTRLRPARGNIFFAHPSEPQLVPFAQFVQPHGDSFAYLWNGTSLWPSAVAAP